MLNGEIIMKEWDDVETSSYWFDVGHDFFMQAKYAEAIACLTEAIRLNPKYANSWGLKGTALHNFGHHDESLTCLTEAIRLNPDKDLLALSLGLKASVLSDLNRNKESFAYLDRAIKIDPDDIHYLEYCC